jgi:hypothetical protein
MTEEGAPREMSSSLVLSLIVGFGVGGGGAEEGGKEIDRVEDHRKRGKAIEEAWIAEDQEELRCLRDIKKQLRDEENKLLDEENKLLDERRVLWEQQVSIPPGA